LIFHLHLLLLLLPGLELELELPGMSKCAKIPI
jgi:hypothetical protein